MIRKINKFYYCLFSLFFLASCQEETLMDKTAGFQITLSDKVTVTTKSTPAELGEPTTDKFKLKIVNEATNNAAYDGAYKSGTIPAAAGTYTVTATFGENPVLALDDPYYKGDTTGVKVEEGQTTSITLNCKVANALASVVFPDATEMVKIYKSYWVKVAVENYSVKLEPNSTKSAYFQAGKEVAFYFEGEKLNGEKGSAKLVNENLPTTFKAADHYKLTLAFNDDLSLDISKVEANSVTITETIPMEWLPAPKVEAEGFDENQKLIFYETEEPVSKIHINSAIGLEQLQFNVNFGDPNYSSLNGDYDLSTMTSEQKQAFENAEIVIPQLAEAEACTFDFTEFAKKLTANQDNNVKSVDNIITLTSVTANGRSLTAEELKAYTISIKKKPVFTVSVDGGNVWSKEFTANPVNVMEGDADIANDAEMTYQYSSDNGLTWNDCNDNINRRQKFDTHPDKRTLKVRAKFRNFTSETVDIELEEPMQLPNSGMEDWYIETKKKESDFDLIKPNSPKTYYTFHPYANGTANFSWWDTNNDKAQGGTYALGIWYEGCFASCVSYTEDAHGGSKAALMYLSGCGDGEANTSETYVGGAMVGSLFIGSYNNGIVQGHDFGVRPTSLTFWYKYKPYNSDAFKVVVSLKNGDKEIATGTYEPTAYSSEDGEYKQASVNFNYSVENEKATTICVQFLASNKTELSRNDFNMGTTITYPVVGNWTVHMGSILKIDDISLVYDK